MRSVVIGATSILLSVGVLTGCGDDAEPGDSDTQEVDTVADTASDTTDDTSTEDTSVADPCTPNPCTTAPAASCGDDGASITEYAAEGVCTVIDGASACDYQVTSNACAPGEVCGLTDGSPRCAISEDPCDLAFDESASYVWFLAVASQIESNGELIDDCCFDFDGDGTVDNRVGEVIRDLGGIVNVDFNGSIGQAIADGNLALVFEIAGLDDWTVDPDVVINGHYARDTDLDFTNNLVGEGVFEVTPNNFWPDTADARYAFEASVQGGILSAGPATFDLSVPVGDGDQRVNAKLLETRLDAKLEESPSGTGVSFDGAADFTANPEAGIIFGARLGGVLPEAELYGGINDFMSGVCTCVSMAGPMVSFDESTNAWECAQAATIDTSACDTTVQTEDICSKIGTFCSLALTIITPDLDRDNDGRNDAFSLGAWLKGVGADITGVYPEACGSP